MEIANTTLGGHNALSGPFLTSYFEKLLFGIYTLIFLELKLTSYTEIDSLLTSTEVKKMWIYTSIPPYAFRA
jgi:hypothetical protein